MFKTILFSIDQSREAREAVDIVTNLVKTYQSQLILLSVVESKSDQESANKGIMNDEKAVAELLQNAQHLFKQKDIDAEIIEKEGKPSFIICDVAEDLKVDLIIMGCRGLGLTEEGAHDSVTNRVINLSPCPVLIVP